MIVYIVGEWDDSEASRGIGTQYLPVVKAPVDVGYRTSTEKAI